MILKLKAVTGASGTNLVQESEPAVVSIEQVLMGKKRKQLLVSKGVRTQVSQGVTALVIREHLMKHIPESSHNKGST